MSDDLGKGASGKPDRAGGLRPEPAAQSQPEALIPSAMTDEALAEALLPGEPDGARVVAQMPAQQRATYERLVWTADELNAGRVPPGVMI